MKRAETLACALALLWAGLVIGGSLIAAPAKFNAPSLSLPIALEVGREQFFAVGIGEAVLAALLIGVLALTRVGLWRLMGVPIAIFAVQRLAIMPPLDARTVEIIAGATVAPSNLHVLFIVLEVAKVLLLIAIAAWGLRTSANTEPAP